MSTVIDNRVVDMQFNNAQFEKGASQSISTLEKLKQSLQFDDEAKGLSELQKGSDRFNLNGVSEALGYVTGRFSKFELAGIVAFTNIVNKGVNLLESKIKDLTFGQAISGWNKYAEKTSAVQTIMAATASDFKDTGEQMNYVNGELEKLNWFTDETSFNFLDMVNNIGKFTANKVPLDEAVTSMQGISTWAAISGANVQEAGRAMYNLSQAIAVGSVKLMDWKSIENANMATAEFKQTVIDTAIELGTLQKKGDDVFVKGNKKAKVSVQNFNSELSRGWFSADVLKKALNRYGEFTNRLYEFSDATGLIASDILDIIDKYRDGSMSIKDIMQELGDTTLTAKQVESMMKGLTDKSMELGEKAFRAAQEAKTFKEAVDSVADAVSTGWMQTFETIFGDYEQAKKLWTAVANELYDIFAESGNKRNELLKEWASQGGRDLLIDGVSKSWAAFKNVLDLVGESFRSVFPEKTANDVLNFTKAIDNASKSLLNFFKVREDAPSYEEINKMMGNPRYSEEEIEYAKEKLKQAEETQKRLNSVQNALKGFFSVINIISKLFGTLGTLVGRFVGYLVPAADGVLEMGGSFGEWLVMLDKAIDEQGIFNRIIEELDPILKTIAGVLKNAVDIASKALGSLAKTFGLVSDSVESMSTKVNSAFKPVELFTKAVKTLFSFLKGGFKAALPILGKVFDTIKEKFTVLSTAFKKGMESGGFSDFLNLVRTGIFGIFVTKITGAFDKLKDTMSVVTGFKETVTNMVKQVIESLNPVKDVSSDGGSTFLKIAAGLAILAFSLTLLAGVDQGLLYSSILAIALLGKIVTSVYSSIQKAKPKTFKDLEGVIVDFSQSVLKNLKGMFTGFKWTSMATALLMISAAVATLAGSVVALSSIGWDGLLRGFVGVVGLVGVLIATAYIMSKMKGKLIEGIGSLVTLATAVQVLTNSVLAFAAIEDPEALMRGVAAVSLLIGVFALFSRISKDMKIASGVSLIAVAAAISILSKSVAALGALDDNTLVKGVVAITALIAALAGFSVAISKFAKGGTMIAGSIGVLVLASAMVVMSKAVAALGSLNVDALEKGIISIVTIMMAYAAMTKIMKGGFGVSVAVVSMAVTLKAISEALKEVAKIPANSVISALIAINATAMVLALLTQITDVSGAIGIAVMATSLISLAVAFKIMSTIPLGGMIASFAAFAIALTGMAIAGALITPQMALSFLTVGLSAVSLGAGMLMASTALLTFTIAIGNAMAALKILASNSQILAVYAIQIILGFINGIIIMMPQIVQTAIFMILTFIYTVAVTIAEYAPMILQAVWIVIQAIWSVILEAIAQIVEIIPFFGKGIADDIRGWKPDIKSAADDALSEIPNSASNAMGKTEDIFDSSQDSMIKNLYDHASDYGGATTELTEQAGLGFSGISDYAEQYGMLGVTTFNTTITNGAPGAETAGKTLKDAAAGATNDPSAYEKTGKSNVQGFINGMLSRIGDVRKAGGIVGNASLEATRATIDSHSPSREAMKIGVNYTTGYAGGIMNRIKDVIAAAKTVGRKSVDALSNAMASTADIINQDIDFSPRIAPVVDLDGVKSGVNSIDTMFGSISDTFRASDIISSPAYIRNSMNTADSINRNLDAERLNDIYNLDAMTDNSDVVGAIGTLKDDISRLGQSMSQLQIVMDSGALVGEIVNPIDTALGRKTVYKGRGL